MSYPQGCSDRGLGPGRKAIGNGGALNKQVPRGGLVGPRLLVDRKLEIRKRRQPLFNSEDAQARDQRAGRKRRDSEAR